MVSIELEHKRSPLSLEDQPLVESVAALHEVTGYSQADSSVQMGAAIGLSRCVHGVQDAL